MIENKDYELVPAADNEQAWDVRILKGNFIETVIRFGNISFDGTSEMLTFNFKIISSPDPDLTEDRTDIQDTVADILENVIENSIKKDEAILTPK